MRQDWIYAGAIAAFATFLLIFAIIPAISHRPSVSISSLSLSQELHQMFIVQYGEQNAGLIMQSGFGGVHFATGQYPLQYMGLLAQSHYSGIMPFTAADLEGCVNPFSNLRNFTSLNNITSRRQAYDTGLLEGRFLHNHGITMDFSPVLGLADNITGCRAFKGDYSTIANYGIEYIKGMQGEGVVSVAKHFPGAALEGEDLHTKSSRVNITPNDLYPFNKAKDQAQGIMVSHQIASGAIDSNGLPSDTSKNVISALRTNYSGLIITDDVNMPSISRFYYNNLTDYTNRTKMYYDLFSAGNDMIIDFNPNISAINSAIGEISRLVEEGNISKSRIDESVRRILKAKGYKVVN